MPLNGKVALVTGSATGIGEAIARRLAADAASVVLHGQHHEHEAGEAIARELESSGASAIFVAAQLEEPSQCEWLIEKAASWKGRLDILVNNAASTARSNLEATDAAFFDRMMAINVRAPMLLIRAARAHFGRAGGGRVLNIGSINGYCGEANLMAYSVSKGALMTLSRNLSDALGREGIRVNHFNLGWVLTPSEYAMKQREGLPPDWPQRIPPAFAPGGRILRPEEVAHFALMFLSDEAALVSGAVVELEQYPMIGRNPLKEA
jgi:NAD(P)-dependent dehydrogenase (short-subunit alcohol dehydrogenase family)